MPTGSNWNKLKNKLTQSTTCNNTKAKNIATDSPLEKEGKRSKKQKERKSNLEKVEDSNSKKSWRRKNGDYVGLDCEMVGIGADGKKSALARACLVDFSGTVIYDKFVRPKGFVTDFRTQWSGVRKRDLREGEAVAFEEVMFIFQSSSFKAFLRNLHSYQMKVSKRRSKTYQRQGFGRARIEE